MTESEALSRMVAPGTHRPGKWGADGFGGVIQIHVTRACNLSCYNCTQGSNLGGKLHFITVEQFEQACASLQGYPGVVGVFGGNPTTHPDFDALCDVLTRYIPRPQRGLWCNHPLGHGRKMRETFNERVSNLNVHLDRAAFDEFKRDWPESMPFGLDKDSRHSPCYVALKDVLKTTCDNCSGSGGYYDHPNGDRYLSDEGVVPYTRCEECEGTGQVYDEAKAWELISGCDINRHWSAMLGVFRGQLRAWFCEIGGAQAMLHQDEPDYPDTGLDPTDTWYFDGSYYHSAPGGSPRVTWWQLPMSEFAEQVRHHCHSCGVPLRGHGELAQESDTVGKEQVSETHAGVFKLKRKNRRIELVTTTAQLGKPLERMTSYIQNAAK